MGKRGVVYVGFSSKSGFHVASTKAGLGRLLGVNSKTVSRNLEVESKVGMIRRGEEMWWVCESKVSKVERVGGPVTPKNGTGFKKK